MSNEQNVHEYMLNRRIRGLLFQYKKGVILLQFHLVRVLKKMHHLPFWALVNDVKSTKSQPNVLYLIE